MAKSNEPRDDRTPAQVVADEQREALVKASTSGQSSK